MKLSAVFYAIVIVAFFMPFFVVSCDQTEVASLSGIKLAGGGEVKLSITEEIKKIEDLGNKYQNPVLTIQPFALIALLIAVVALILVLVLPVQYYLIPAYISITGVLSLQLLNVGILQIIAAYQPLFDPSVDLVKILIIKAQPAFWLANLAFILGGIYTLITGVKNSTISAPALEPERVDEEFINSEIQSWEEEYPVEETISEQEEENMPPEEEIPTLIEEDNLPPEEENPTLMEKENKQD